jgi:hypothetical protein
MVPGFNNNTIWSWPRGRGSQSASPVQTPRQLIVDSAFPACQMLVGYGQLRGRVSIIYVIFSSNTPYTERWLLEKLCYILVLISY